MSDPLSIMAGVVGLLGAAVATGTALKDFHDGAAMADAKVKGLMTDVESFTQVLKLMKDTLGREQIQSSLQATGHIGSHWTNLSTSIGDAQNTLTSLQETLEKVNKSVSVLDGPRKYLRLKSASEEIGLYQLQIRSYRDAMQLSMQTVILWNQVTFRESTDKILPNLDELHQLIRKIAIDINNRMNTLQNAVESSSSKDSEQLHSLTNLQNCVRSAASVVSSASTTLAVDQPDHFSVTYGSEFGDVFPAQPGETMLRWISSNTVYEFEEELNSDLGSGVNVTSEKILQPVDEGTGSEQSDSDNDLEVEIFQVLLNKGKERLGVKDYQGAERLFKNCLARTSSSGSLVSLHRIPKSKSEIMNLLLDTYLAQEKWSEAQAILLEKIALASRDNSKDSGGVLAEMLTLIEVLLHKNSYAEALLYGRRALKGYRKLGSEGIGGVEKSLRVLVRICHLDENFDEEDAYTTILSDFLKQHPPRRKPSPSSGRAEEVSEPTSPSKSHQADQKVSGHPPTQQAPSSPKETSVPAQDNKPPNFYPIRSDDPRRFLTTQPPRDKEPTREECLAVSDEQCQSILQNRGPNTSATYKDWELPHQTHLVRLYMTKMSFPEIKECMKTEFGITYPWKTYSTWYKESGLPVDSHERAKAIRELWAFISKPRTLPSTLSHESSSRSAAGNRDLLTPLPSPPAQDEAIPVAETPKRYHKRQFSENTVAKPLNIDGFREVPLANSTKAPWNNHLFYRNGSSATKPASHLDRASNPDLRNPFSSSQTPIADSFRQTGLEVVSNQESTITVQLREEPKQFSDKMSQEEWMEYEEMQHQSSKGIMFNYETASFTAPSHSPVGQSFPDALTLPSTNLLVPTRELSTSRSANSVLVTHPKPPSLRGTEFRRRLVIVGESYCGKTSLLLVFCKEFFPEVYFPTVFEDYVADVEIDGKYLKLTIRDTAGQDDYYKSRLLSYRDQNIVLMSFAIDSPDEMDIILDNFVPEIQRLSAGVPILLVGLKMDLRNDPKTIAELGRTGQHPVTPAEGVSLAKKIGAFEYLECSAKTGEGVREVFKTASRMALASIEKDKERKGLRRLFARSVT